MGKHSSQSNHRPVARAAVVGGAAATAAVMTVGMAAPSANAANPAKIQIPSAIEPTINIGEGVAKSGQFFVEGVVAQPINAAALAAAIAQGKDEQVAYLIQAAIDGPLWVAKPTFDALIAELPAPLGGEDGLINDLYVRAWEVRQAVRQLVLGTDEDVPKEAAPDVAELLQGAVQSFVAVGQGLGTSGIRAVEAAALQPVVAVLLAGAVVQGDEDVARYLVQQEIDGPLWVADPAFEALRDNLSEPLGKQDGFVWGVREQAYEVRQAVRKLVLGTDETFKRPANLPSFLPSTQDNDSLRLASVQEQPTLSVAEAAPQNESRTEISNPPASTKPDGRKVSLFNLTSRADNSSVATEGRKPVAEVRNQHRTATENTQNQINSAVTNATKRFNNAAENFGRRLTGRGDSSDASVGGDAGTTK